MNLGAFTDFARLCEQQALDLYAGSSGVSPHDFQGAHRAEGSLEPWLHRFDGFATFVDRLEEHLRQNPIPESTVDRSGRTAHSLIICLPGQELANLSTTQGELASPASAGTAIDTGPLGRPIAYGRPVPVPQIDARVNAASLQTEAAPRWKNDILRALQRLNMGANTDTSIVLFAAVSAQDSEGRKVASGMEFLLSDHPQDEGLHHSRNGIVAVVPENSEDRRFVALRLLVQIMQDEGAWGQLRGTANLAITRGKTAVNWMSTETLPGVTAGEVIAAALATALGSNGAHAHGQHPEGNAQRARQEDEEFAAVLNNTVGKIERDIPVGKRDPTQRADREAISEANAYGILAPPKLALPAVAKAIADGANGNLGADFLDRLETWYQQSVQKLNTGNFKTLAKSLIEVDSLLDGYRSKLLPQGSALRDRIDSARADTPHHDQGA